MDNLYVTKLNNMTKFQELESLIEATRVDYLMQEQDYINNYYYNHETAMLAFEHMNLLKKSLNNLRSEYNQMKNEINYQIQVTNY